MKSIKAEHNIVLIILVVGDNVLLILKSGAIILVVKN